jgi:RecA-family ATPase
MPMSANHGAFVPDPSWPTIVELAIKRWGQPNRKLSKPDEIRFGEKGSKSVRPSDNTWFDHEANEGGGYVDLHEATIGPLPKRERPGGNGKLPPWEDIKTTYPYHDADGDLILQVVRTISGEPRFRQRRPSGDGKWIWSVKDLPGHDRLLYRLPELRAAPIDEIVWICEGEKDADRLHNAGLTATTNISGAGKWRREYAEEFRGKRCVVLQDNDPPAIDEKTKKPRFHPDGRPVLPGQDHAAHVARCLVGIAASVKVLLLPGLPVKGDVSDWLDAAHTIDELERLAREAPESDLSGAETKPDDDFWRVPDDHELPQARPVMHRASDWATRVIPQMRWIVEDWIPRQQVTGLYGVGGSLKTMLLLQALMARVAELPFLGRVMERGPSLGVFCEDTAEEIARRKATIAAFYKRPLSDFHDFHWISLVGVEETELVTFDGQRMQKTHLLRCLDHYIQKHSIGFVGLDTVAHFFGGEEVRRREVARFIRTLDNISIGRDCSILFTAQPSVRGRNTGTMESGSTHWEAGVRSRLGWQDPSAATEDTIADADPNLIRRVLTRLKSNYARPGETMELIYRDGGFIPAAVDAEAAKLRQRGPGRDAACEQRFLELLAKIAKQGGYVHDSPNDLGHYAAEVFSKRPDGRPFSKPEYTRAMARLFTAERLRLEPFGPPSRGRYRLAEDTNA